MVILLSVLSCGLNISIKCNFLCSTSFSIPCDNCNYCGGKQISKCIFLTWVKNIFWIFLLSQNTKATYWAIYFQLTQKMFTIFYYSFITHEYSIQGSSLCTICIMWYDLCGGFIDLPTGWWILLYPSLGQGYSRVNTRRYVSYFHDFNIFENVSYCHFCKKIKKI